MEPDGDKEEDVQQERQEHSEESIKGETWTGIPELCRAA